MLRFAKLASPFVAATVVVPANVPSPGLLPSATVTVPVKVVTVFPSPSCAVTCTAGAIAAPAAVLAGCTLNANRDADGAVSANGADVGRPGSPQDDALSV